MQKRSTIYVMLRLAIAISTIVDVSEVACAQVPKLKAESKASGANSAVIDLSSSKISSSTQVPKDHKWMSLGVHLFATGHIEKSISCFDSVIKSFPNCGEAYRRRGHAYLDTGREEEALADLNRAVQLNSDDFDAHFVRSEVYSMLSNYKGTLADLSICKRLQPENPVVYGALGKLCADRKDWNAAVANFTREIKLSGYPRWAFVRRAAAFSAMGRDQDACADYLLSLKRWPTDVESAENLLNCLQRLGKTEESIKVSAAFLKISPKDRVIRWHRAQILYKAKRYEQAIVDLDFLLKQSILDDEALQLRAQCLMALQQYPKAIRDLSKCIELDAGNSSEQYRLRSKAYKELGQFKLANADLDQANRTQRK